MSRSVRTDRSGRRQGLLRGIGMILSATILLGGLTACGQNAGEDKKRYTASYTDVFDTVTDFTAYCGTRAEFDAVADAVHEELVRLHRLFDIYRDDADTVNLYRLNRDRGIVGCDPALTELLTLGQEMYAVSGGQLNIAMGGVLRLWHDHREARTGLPSEEELREAAAHTDLHALRIEGDGVWLDEEGVTLDVGAIAKGYSAQKASEKAIAQGCEAFILNLGGNVIAHGTKNGQPWRIGIEDPRQPDQAITVLSCTDVSVVTSGDYQRYYEYDGRRYSHIIDPQTLFPAERYASVTVVGADSGIADALSTALFCLPIEEGERLTEQYGFDAMWIGTDGAVYKTKGFSAYEA